MGIISDIAGMERIFIGDKVKLIIFGFGVENGGVPGFLITGGTKGEIKVVFDDLFGDIDWIHVDWIIRVCDELWFNRYSRGDRC